MKTGLCSWCGFPGDLTVTSSSGWQEVACIVHIRRYFSLNAIHPHLWRD